jgi:hypothetical protein
MGAGTVAREARLGRTVLLQSSEAAKKWTERETKQRIRTDERKASVLHSTLAPDR